MPSAAMETILKVNYLLIMIHNTVRWKTKDSSNSYFVNRRRLREKIQQVTHLLDPMIHKTPFPNIRKRISIIMLIINEK